MYRPQKELLKIARHSDPPLIGDICASYC